MNDVCGDNRFEIIRAAKEQKAAMGNYLHCLEVRAQIEEVEL